MGPKPSNQIWMSLVIFSLIVFGCVHSRFTGSGVSTSPEGIDAENSDHGMVAETPGTRTLGDIRSTIAIAESTGAKKIAPLSHAHAVEMQKNLEAFIFVNPEAGQEIDAMAKDALFEANRLTVITEMGIRLKKMRLEETVLFIERQLQTISETIGAPDMRNRPIQIQLNNILESIASLKQERSLLSETVEAQRTEIEAQKAAYRSKIDALHVRVATLEDQSNADRMAKERMAQERSAVERQMALQEAFNQRYVTVRNYFSVDEADVYKQESRLIIRLKAMHFPVGKSVIVQENDELLEKVQKAINAFEDPRVIVEGHTDATGSKELNLKLSQQRAEAVSHYLIANKALPPENISAVGYGSDRPIASNKTSAGRAINRRIDIMIIPETKTM